MTIINNTRDVHDFTFIDMHGYGDIHVIQNPNGPESLLIEADEQVIPRIKSEVINGRLILGPDDDWRNIISWVLIPNKEILYTLTLKSFTGCSISGSGSLKSQGLEIEKCRLSVSGSARISIESLKGTALETIISGSGDINLVGELQNHEIHMNGTGTIHAASLATAATKITIHGAGRAEVSADQTLDISVSGSGNVKYHGQPKIKQHITGSASIEQIK